jgi:REP-associated tyrosine transposase
MATDRERFRRRHLPHWDMPGAPYFVTSCLHDSVPVRGLLELSRYRTELRQRPKSENLSADEWSALCWKRAFVRLEDWLDGQPASRLLENPELAQVVVNSLLHFANERYTLFAFVVMPSHFHWLFQPIPGWVESSGGDPSRSPRERITYSINRFTSTTCNRLLNAHGRFWQPESYDHWVRDQDELERIIAYIEANPVKAGISASAEEYLFSSACHRRQTGAETEWGLPLAPLP